jgi:hypothetical protein
LKEPKIAQRESTQAQKEQTRRKRETERQKDDKESQKTSRESITSKSIKQSEQVKKKRRQEAGAHPESTKESKCSTHRSVGGKKESAKKPPLGGELGPSAIYRLENINSGIINHTVCI